MSSFSSTIQKYPFWLAKHDDPGYIYVVSICCPCTELDLLACNEQKTLLLVFYLLDCTEGIYYQYYV